MSEGLDLDSSLWQCVLRHVTSPWELRFLNGETELLLTVVLHCRGDLNDAIRAGEKVLTFIVDYI